MMQHNQSESAYGKYEDSIIDFLNKIERLDEEAAEYLSKGSFRKCQVLTKNEKERVKNLQETHDMAKKQCYRNCQTLILHEPSSDYKYVEGYVMSDIAPIPIQHAWIEVNGIVWEVTTPNSPDLPTGATYYGTHYPSSQVCKQLAEIEAFYPVAGDSRY